MSSPEIRVGVDGSPASRVALQWAAREAVARGTELHVVHAYEWRVLGARAPIGGAVADQERTQAQALVDSSIELARAAAPGVVVRGDAVLGSPVPVLAHPAGDVSLTVVGSRGRGGFASLLLGSVSHQVATHATGPIVVIRGQQGAATGPIVVGVDGSETAGIALGAAFEEAAARNAGVLAVRVCPPVYGLGVPDAPPLMVDDEERRAESLRELNEEVDPWRDKFPAVPVDVVVLDGHAGEVLTGLSAAAQLVVVGTRGHGGFTGLLVGSVVLALLHHAECPVLIARPASTIAS